MKLLTATQPHVYASKQRRVGEVYSATDLDAKIIVAMKKASAYVYAESTPEVVPAPRKAGRPKGSKNKPKSGPKTYKRRDMRAEQ